MNVSVQRGVMIGIGGAVTALAVLSALLLVTGHAPGPALAALASGAFGSKYALSSTVVRSVPLALNGLAVTLAFRAGLLNIGAEGQLLMGACVATAAGAFLGHAPAVLALPTMLLAATVAGAGWALVAAELRRRFGVLEVISTIMLNFVALYAVSFLVRGPLQEPTHAYPQTSAIAEGIRLARIPGAGRLHVGFVIAIMLLLVCGWIFRHTAAGFRLLATGENPAAARSAGQINLARTTTIAFLSSGALAGAAGAVELLASPMRSTRTFLRDMDTRQLPSLFWRVSIPGW